MRELLRTITRYVLDENHRGDLKYKLRIWLGRGQKWPLDGNKCPEKRILNLHQIAHI